MSKKISIHQPNFLPWSGYFHKIVHSDVFIFLDNVDIEINTSKAITTRTKIKGPSGEQWLTIPLKKGESKLIQDLSYSDIAWRAKLLKTIAMNYGKSPYFKEVYPLIEKIIMFESNHVSDFNINSILQVTNYLGFKPFEHHKASLLGLENNDRNERIIEICRKTGAQIYFSGRGGKNYHDESRFKQNGIEIEYTTYEQTPYAQLFGEFIPNLSVIDSLFNTNSI